LHELVTNSAKYGALSTLSGRLSIKWETKADMLQMVWEERDGPVVEKPVSRGFGTRSVIASIESQLGGQAEFDWRSEGLVCRLSVPLVRDMMARQTHHHEKIAINGNGAELELASRSADA
jgi:two-component sensor histidine kinase